MKIGLLRMSGVECSKVVSLFFLSGVFVEAKAGVAIV